MKKLKNLAFLLILGMIATSCGEDPPAPPTAEEARTALLVGTWTTSSVVYDGQPDARDWAAFTITFTDGGYTTSGSADAAVWPSTGTWVFKEGGVSTLVRNDLLEMGNTVNDPATDLTLTFDFVDPNGRTSGLTGPWEFKMKK